MDKGQNNDYQKGKKTKVILKYDDSPKEKKYQNK